MKFNAEEYTAGNLFTIYSENYYKTPIKNDEETKEGIWVAREDWNEQGSPARKRLDHFFAQSLHMNQQYYDLCLRYRDTDESSLEKGIPPLQEDVSHRHVGKLVCGIYSRANDEFIGWDLSKTVYREYQNLYMAMLPKYREQGIARETEIAGGKYIFTVADYEMSRTAIPVSEGNMNSIVDIAVGFTAHESESHHRGFPVQYGEIVVTRDSFSAWLETADEKDHHFSYIDSWQ